MARKTTQRKPVPKQADMIEGQKVTRTGRVVKIFDESIFTNNDTGIEEGVRNFEIVVIGPEELDQYWQCTCYGDEALEAIEGNFLNADATAYEPKRPALKVGDRVTITGNFRFKPWESEKFGLVRKPTLTVYNPQAIKLIRLPGRLSKQGPQETPPKRQTKTKPKRPTRKPIG